MDKQTTPLFEVMRQTEARKSGSVGRSLNPFGWIARGRGLGMKGAAGEAWQAGAMVLTRPVVFHLPLASLVVIGMAVIGLVIAVGVIGFESGQQRSQASEQSYDKLVEPLRELRDKPPKALIPATVAGVEASAARAPDQAVTATGTTGDPRQAGLNYFRLTVLPSSAKEELLRATTYLKTNGVDAALIPVNNGRSLKLVALRGFAKPYSDPAAKQYENDLKALGRRWKSQEKGTMDWKDMIPEKYKPGVN
jgi:hypothetical protein